MNIKRYMTTFLLSLVSFITLLAQNTLSVGSLTGGQGKNVTVPVSMDNVDEVVAVQFDLQLPFAMTSGAMPTLSSTRNVNGHTVSVRQLGGNKYTIVIVNMGNRPLVGNGGTLVSIPMTVPTGLDPETTHAISLSNVVITNRNGDNIQTGFTDGSYTVQRSASPDLEVSDVALKESTLTPGQKMTVTWKMGNIGSDDTHSGWTERVYLVSTTTEERVHIGNTYFNKTLVKGGHTSRTATLDLPQAIGLEGEVTAMVVAEPNSGCGEYSTDRLNNTATGGTAELLKRLFLHSPATSVKEGQAIRLTLKRSGDRSTDETFTITTSLPDNTTVPQEVTIGAGQSAATFDVNCPDNDIVNTYKSATIAVAESNGYPDGAATTLTIDDDELLPISVRLDKDTYNEGETVKATVSVPYRIEGEELKVYFSIEKPKRFRLPQSYTFADGATSAVIDIPIVQDNLPANDETIQLNVSADHHLTGSALLILKDDDVPAISMTLLPATVSEGAGYNAIHATIKRTGATNSKVTLKLSDNGEDQIYYTTPITMPEGVEEVTVPIGVRDNQRVDGTREVTLKAAVYITDCGCSAIGDKQTVVEEKITITDNDGPTLTVTSDKTTILEGDTKGATLTISRNDGTSSPLNVKLTAKGEALQFTQTVTIPAGAESVTTPFVAIANDDTEGNRTVSVMASSDGYSPGTVWMLVSDQTLPDAEMQTPECVAETVAGSKTKVRVTVRNIGVKPVPRGTAIRTSIGSVSTMTQTDTDIAPGETFSSEIELTAPDVPGSYRVTAEINPSGSLTELQTINNSASADIKVLTAYVYTLTTTKDKYLIGDKAVMTGTAKTIGGAAAAGIDVEPFIVYAGARTALAANADADGRFTVEYTIPAGMGGEYEYGVCTPGESSCTKSGTFKVYGFSRTTTEYVKNQMYVGEPCTGKIKVKNMSDMALHHLITSCENSEQYTVTFNNVDELPGNGTAEIEYSISASSVSKTNDWDRLTFSVTSDEGATLDITTYNYAQEHKASLAVSTNSISTTVTKGKTRTYPVVLTNTGLAETGKITVSLPSGLSRLVSLATPATMPSLGTGDSATIVLKFNAADFDVNVVQKGNIAVNCDKTDGRQVFFNVKVVSEEKGNLLVRVRDENTIYGNKNGEHPYVANASVRLTDYNTGAVVASDVTGDDGSLTLHNLNEGYYHLHVTADKHDTYEQNVLVSPGETTEHLATISYRAISVDWTVEETEIDDEYEISTKLTFETQVPVPVVEMTSPESLILKNIEKGKSALFNVVLRNRGLIAAQNVQYVPPSHDGFVFMPMVENTGFTLAPEQSYVIPVLVMHEEDFNSADFASNAKRNVIQRSKGATVKCFGSMGTGWEWPCGDNGKYSWLEKPIKWVMENAECSDTSKGRPISPEITYPKGPAEWPGGNGPGTPEQTKPGTGKGPYGEPIDAETLKKIACTMLDCLDLPDLPPCGGAAINYLFGGTGTQFFNDCAEELFDQAAEKYIPFYGCLKSILRNFFGIGGSGAKRSTASEMEDEEDKPLPALYASSGCKQFLFYRYFATYDEYNRELINAPKMFEMKDFRKQLVAALHNVDGELELMRKDGSLWTFDLNTIPDNTSADDKSQGIGAYLTSFLPNKSANIADFSLRSYVERVRNTWRKEDGMNYDSGNHMDESRVADILATRQKCVAKLVELGIPTWYDLIVSARKDMLQYMEEQSGNTCANVKLEIKQKLVLTRQAFRGTLTIENGSANDISDILVSVNATNMETGLIATSREMQISVESIDGFSGDKDGTWSLGAGQKGVATILFIPTKHAAPENLTTYSFGGTLSLNDGNSVQNRTLYPVSLQVKPSPELDLTYFMQRDIYGDNPLTEDVVEPTVPAEFSVLIHNKGNGDANNVRMITQQPQIVENEKGLLVEFNIVSSSLNGGEKAMALDKDVATQFGTIAAGASSYATWDLTSSLLGHFTDYDVSVTHVTDYGNPDLSLLDRVEIHELIHSVNATIGDKVYRAWITNDMPDGNDEPDHIYFANGTDEELATLNDAATIEPIGNNRFRVNVATSSRQWFYASVANPAGKYAKVLSITDETTGKQLDPANFWTTDYTMRDGIDPMPDYRLHIADIANGSGTNKYVVEFEPMPNLRLDVESIKTVPADDEIAESPINELTVEFNKDINPTTFSREDIVLRHEGKAIDTDLPITAQNGTSKRVFKLDTSSLTDNGYYVLQVKSDNITDAEGFLGADGKMVRWMLFKDGLVNYDISILPHPSCGAVSCDTEDESAGTKTGTGVFMAPKSTGGLTGSLSYGKTLTLTATANKGYRFVHWKNDADGQILSTEATYKVEAQNVVDVSAVFEAETYTVTVDCPDEAGTMETATGIYEYGTILHLDAKANDGFQLLGYRINGEMTGSAEPIDITIDGTTDIEVLFRDLTPQSVLLDEGTDYEPTEVEAANVSLYRTFQKSAWNTICLPCEINNPEEVFGTGTLVARLAGMTPSSLVFSYVTKMEANVPYIIMPTKINSVMYTNASAPALLYDIGATSLVKPDGEQPEDVMDNVRFIGAYSVFTVPTGNGFYYISGNKFYYIDSNATVSTTRFRGFFHTDMPSAAKLNLSFGEETGIEGTLMQTPDNSDVYDLTGKKVRSKGETVSGLKPGIYITRDRKFIVK